MNNWKPASHFNPPRCGIDGLIVIECAAIALFVIAGIVSGFI